MAWMTKRGRVAVAAAVVVGAGAGVGAFIATRPDGAATRSIPAAIVMPGLLETTVLPDPPIGSWDRYNVVPLVDGSGFVVGGGADDPDGEYRPLEASLEAAWFRFDTGQYEVLPALPVQAGLGNAAGVRVGTTIVVVGQDCPPGPEASAYGVEFCSGGGVGAKVVLTWSDGDDRWTRHQLPDAMLDFAAMSPTVIGVADAAGVDDASENAAAATESTVWLSSRVNGRDRIAIEFSPSTGEFGSPATLPPGADQACVLSGDLHAFGGWTDETPSFNSPPDSNAQWSWNGTEWVTAPPFVVGDAAAHLCAVDSLFVFTPRTRPDVAFVDYVVSLRNPSGDVRRYAHLIAEPGPFAPYRYGPTASPAPLIEVWQQGVDESNQPLPLVDDQTASWVVLTPAGPRPVDLEMSGWVTRVQSLGRYGLVESVDGSRYVVQVVGLSD